MLDRHTPTFDDDSFDEQPRDTLSFVERQPVQSVLEPTAEELDIPEDRLSPGVPLLQDSDLLEAPIQLSSLDLQSFASGTELR